MAGTIRGGVIGAQALLFTARFDLAATDAALEREAAYWHELIRVRRQVSRAAWNELAATATGLAARPRRYRVVAGKAPAEVGKARGQRSQTRGRRTSGAPNALG